MSKVRVLVGTRKGAFVLTSDGKRERWDVSGPHFAGWEIYHVKVSPAVTLALALGMRMGRQLAMMAQPIKPTNSTHCVEVNDRQR